MSKHLDIYDQIAEIVQAKVASDLKNVDDRVIDAIVRVYKLHNEDFECTCDYCLAMRMAADLARRENDQAPIIETHEAPCAYRSE